MEGKRMNEMNQWQAVYLLEKKMPEAARGCSWTRRLRLLCHSVIRIQLSPLQGKANTTLQNSLWEWFGG